MKYTEDRELRKKRLEKTLYVQAVGCLLYLFMDIRLDIMYATSKVSKKIKIQNMKIE